jgi:hypothetical protein
MGGKMEEEQAKRLIELNGYKIGDIKNIAEGQGHDNFNVVLADGQELVARFAKETRKVNGQRRDPQYNGRISLSREAYMCGLVRDKAQLPAPEVMGLHETDGIEFLMMEKMPGKHWKEFLEENNYALSAYLSSMQLLGADIASAQKINFDSYGDIMQGGRIDPGMINLAERLEQIMSLKLQREGSMESLTPDELQEVEKYFKGIIRDNSEPLVSDKPTLILSDIHPMNFHVNESGKPSGFFDLEFCQAGHPAFEFYYIGVQLFSYFNTETFNLAQDAFFRGYHQAGGDYDPNNEANKKLEGLLFAGQTLSCVTAYHGAKDGSRDNWSEEFKEILFNVISSGKMDYVAYADVIRQKTQQPTEPTAL